MLAVAYDDRCKEHDTGRGHPERAARLDAVRAGLDRLDADRTLVLEPRLATDSELARAHEPRYLERVSAFIGRGGGHLDADTVASPASWEAARLAAGSGLAAIDALRAGSADSAFCAARPPGHHAESNKAMGFCLLNNVAVAAAALVAAGERVLVVDWDAHHGNGTQQIFWNEPAVLYVSFHEYPLYPGTGELRETGGPNAPGTTVNVPFPADATGDVYRRGIDELVAPLAAQFRPDWVLVSAGYDAHHADPLTGLALTAGDFADLTVRIQALAGPQRLIVVLEGGYDLTALTDGVAATGSALLGVASATEAPSRGGPGNAMVDAARRVHGV